MEVSDNITILHTVLKLRISYTKGKKMVRTVIKVTGIFWTLLIVQYSNEHNGLETGSVSVIR
jgi:hypothetical protein